MVAKGGGGFNYQWSIIRIYGMSNKKIFNVGKHVTYLLVAYSIHVCNVFLKVF